MHIGKLAIATIPAPANTSSLKYARGYTADIMQEVFDCYNDGKYQLNDFAQHLRQPTLLQTCRAIWQFVHGQIQYKIDPPFQQLIKEPARLYADREGDCKSYSVFIASCLYNLGINGMFRFVSFNNSELPTHVYVVVPDKQGKEIIIDAVLPWFNREKAYTYKHDYSMTQISRLSGFDSLPDRSPKVAGFFDGLFGVNKKHVDLWRSNLSQTCGAYLYMFIPDSIIASMPAKVQAKRLKQIESCKFMDGKADNKYSYSDAVNDLQSAIIQTYGRPPLQVIDFLFGTHIGAVTGSEVVGVLTIFAGAMKNIAGKYGSYGFAFPGGLNPGEIAPAQDDWTGYAMMNTSAGSALPAASNTSTSTAQQALSSAVQQSSMNPWLMWGLVGAGVFMLFKK